MTAGSDKRTVVRVFPGMDAARASVRDLRAAGIPAGDISLVANTQSQVEHRDEVDIASRDVVTDVAADAGIGAALGGIGGLLLGLTAIVIPGIGPVMAAGPLLAAIGGAGLGAVAGGLIGALSEAGIPADEAEDYANQVRSGSVLITVQTSAAEADRVRDILDRDGAIGDSPVHIEGPASPSAFDQRTDDDLLPHSGTVVGHNAGGEPMSADEALRDYTHYAAQNAGRGTWPHQEAFDLEESLVRPEVLEAEEDAVAAAQRSSRSSVRARIYQNDRRE